MFLLLNEYLNLSKTHWVQNHKDVIKELEEDYYSAATA